MTDHNAHIRKASLLAGMMATLAGVGLSRFAYTPLLPELVEQQWFTGAEAAYLGAANLMGYLIGAMAASRLSTYLPLRTLLGVCFTVIVLSFVLCAGPFGFAWFFLWRLLSGVAGAVLMVLGPSTALAAAPPEQRARIGAWVFTGIGAGALLSATVVPLLAQMSLGWSWLVLGLISALVAAVGVWGLQQLHRYSGSGKSPRGQTLRSDDLPVMAITGVIVAYMAAAAGYVPHTVFWVDYLVREKALGTAVGAFQWALFGLGAMMGPMISGWMVRLMGWRPSLLMALFVMAAAIGAPLLSVAVIPRTASSLLVGILTPAVVGLVAGRLMELVGPERHKSFWGLATAAFALAQAVSGYGMSALFEYEGSYQPLFLIGCLIVAAGALIVTYTGRRQPGR